MSKSKGNIVNPDEYIEKHGADTLRCYLMFCGRFTQGGDFSDAGIEGMARFLKRVWQMVGNWESSKVGEKQPTIRESHDPNNLHLMHKTIKKITGDIESLDYNTAISALMEWVNALEARSTIDNSQLTTDKKIRSNVKGQLSNVSVEELQVLLKLLAPFAPHMTEELWQRIKKHESRSMNQKNNSEFIIHNSIHLQSWPKYDPRLAEASEIVLVVQVNGKVRDKIIVERGIDKERVQKLALASGKVTKYLGKAKLKRTIFVRDRLINFVV